MVLSQCHLFLTPKKEIKKKKLPNFFFLISKEECRKERLPSGQVLALNTLHNQLETLC